MGIPSPEQNPKLWDSLTVGKYKLEPPLFVVRLKNVSLTWITSDNKAVGKSGGIPSRRGTKPTDFIAEIDVPSDHLSEAWVIWENLCRDFNPQSNPNKGSILNIYHPSLALLRITKAVITKIDPGSLTNDLLYRCSLHFKSATEQTGKSVKPKKAAAKTADDPSAEPSVYNPAKPATTKKDQVPQPNGKPR